MAFLTAMAEQLNQPGGLWELLILKVFGFITNYGWRILLFVILLKLVLLPLDIFQRVKMRKNQRITEKLKPQMEKLQQQYAGDKQTLSQKQMELNRREGFSYFSSCLPMIITLAIFFYLFSGLNNISQYMNLKQYSGIYDEYVRAEQVYKDIDKDGYNFDEFMAKYNVSLGGKEEPNTGLYVDFGTVTDEEGRKDKLPIPDTDGKIATADEKAAYQAWLDSVNEYTEWLKDKEDREIEMTDFAQDAVVVYYENTSKESWLWVKNIWSADVPWTKPILSNKTFTTNIGDYANFDKAQKKLKLSEAVTKADYEKMLRSYETVTDKLYKADSNKTNGLLILPILSVGLSFLSQFITSKLQKKSGQAAPTGGMANSMKVMMIIMPLMMGFFALQYTTAFTLYIVINSGMSVLINVFTTLAMGTNDRMKKMKDSNPDKVIKYGRPDPKDL